ncbi:hypothetical protein [Streptomyces sp. NPDC056061]|uniref:hypothetical protein n=1 Tax=Streptomyces sp. NPDC056061 TaxID=3345700 RepID=UPI0035DF605D
MSVTSWHASPQRAAMPHSNPSTGEVPLVLSQAEAETLRDTLTALLSGPSLVVA